jgi:tetratricopeptide (TPR) repeat protein
MRLRVLALYSLIVLWLSCVSTTANVAAQTSAPQTPAEKSAPGNSVVDDLSFWSSIKDSKNPEDFSLYLKKFPHGEFADLARIRVATLSKSPANSPGLPAGTRGGIGIQFEIREHHALIKQIDPNGPAAQAGLKPQDEIVRVDGRETAQMTQEEIVAAVRGTVGTQVTLTIRSGETSQMRDAVLTRAYSAGLAAAQYADAGVEFEKKQLWAEAEAQYRKALGLANGVAWYHGSLGYVLNRQNKLAEAETEYRKALELEPKTARYHLLLAFLLYSRIGANAEVESYGEALGHAQEAVQLDAKDAWNHNMLGLVLLAQKKWSEAENQFSEAIRLDPKIDEFKANLVKAQKHKRS